MPQLSTNQDLVAALRFYKPVAMTWLLARTDPQYAIVEQGNRTKVRFPEMRFGEWHDWPPDFDIDRDGGTACFVFDGTLAELYASISCL